MEQKKKRSLKNRLGFFARLVVLAILLFLFVVMIDINMQINSLQDEYDTVSAELEKQKEAVAKVQEALDAPYSEETIRRIAREELGLCNPGDIIFESDSPN